MKPSGAGGLDSGVKPIWFGSAKLMTARFYLARVLPQTTSLNHQIKAGAATLMALPAEAF